MESKGQNLPKAGRFVLYRTKNCQGRGFIDESGNWHDPYGNPVINPVIAWWSLPERHSEEETSKCIQVAEIRK